MYIDNPFWNPLKKRGEHKRKYVGKLVGNLFVPNASYLLELANFDVKAITKPNKTVTKKTFSYLYGSTYLLDRIADTLGIREDLEVTPVDAAGTGFERLAVIDQAEVESLDNHFRDGEHFLRAFLPVLRDDPEDAGEVVLVRFAGLADEAEAAVVDLGLAELEAVL